LSGISRSVSEVAAVGVRALDDLKGHRAVSAEAREKDLQMLKAAGKPQAVLLNELVGPVTVLVKAGK
jgi:hypothetical protein